MKKLIFLLFFTFALPWSSEASSRSAELQELMLSAQDAYFTIADIEVAKSRFQKIAQLKDVGGWESSDQKMIHFSILRLAQISSNPIEKDQWLKEARLFAPDLEIDKELFPPALVARYTELTRVPQPRSKAQTHEPLKLQIQPAATSVSSQPSEPDLPQSPPSENLQRPFWKNRWIWMGVGTLVAGYMIYESQKSPAQAPQEPSVTHGL